MRGTVFARCAGGARVIAAGVKGEQRKSDCAGECDFFECVHIKTLLLGFCLVKLAVATLDIQKKQQFKDYHPSSCEVRVVQF